MGYRRSDNSAIFLWQGAAIGAGGALIGCLLGALMTWGVSHIPIRLRGLLYTNYFLVTWDWRHYVFATFLALLAVFIASYVPARRAAELPPVTTIRGSRFTGRSVLAAKESCAIAVRRRNACTPCAAFPSPSRAAASTR